ncbi:SAM-dependent methyltransferase [Microtetraspora niveoalba]|uniref:SAM-dependent methyltransferase n=1 Tax=Microtetraspora niveoalba TaxID=46175 RepID=UPI00082C2611|nr:SAM-dependent methyltransferase [Microtetraspora niveoalba]
MTTTDGTDTTRPSPARMYDYFLGGGNNFDIDRQTAERVMAVSAETVAVARSNRRFLIEAVRYAAGRGIRQFLDIGSGLPTAQNVHEVARAVAPEARTLYADNDPSVLPHARALIAGDELTRYIEADARDPEGILTHPETVRLMDFSRPVALLMVAVLHFVRDADDPRGIVAGFMSELPSGSVLILSHVTVDGIDPALWERIQVTNPSMAVPLNFRTGEEIGGFFDGLDLVDPGMVDCRAWAPGGAIAHSADALRTWCGVAVKR